MSRTERWLAALLAAGLWVTLLIDVTAFRAVLVNRSLMAAMADRQAEIGAVQRALLSEQRAAAARNVQANQDRQRIVQQLDADEAQRLDQLRRTLDRLRSIGAVEAATRAVAPTDASRARSPLR